MRTQRNPNYRKPSEHTIKPIVLLAVTHWLEDSDYHKDRLQVIQTCLETMRERVHFDHTFFVWDNGSGGKLRDWLRDDFNPDILVQSKNYGKGIARAYAVHMLPPETLICYADDDMYFFDNWLIPQIELLYHFPDVSIVSGYPIRTQFRRGCENTLAWAENNAQLERGVFIPDEWEKQHAASVGRSWEKYKKLTEKDIDYLITYKGKKAYATAHHCQFIGFGYTLKKVIDVAVEGAMPDEWPLDEAFDKIGLRLCTTDRLCRHVGNVLDKSFDV